METNIFKESNWNRLLDEIESGQIIPILGSELLTVNVDSKEVLFYSWIARELADRLDVRTEEFNSLTISSVIYEFQNKRGCDPTQPYYEIFDIIRHAKFQIPNSLKILAQISPFKLFLSTTIDDFLERALNEYRYQNAGEQMIKSISFSKSGFVEDIPSFYQGSIVYHMFGKANTLSTYVATEEDLLEFCQKWSNSERTPPVLSSILKEKEKYYLLLGCNFPNWFARFFLYGVKSETLFDQKSKRGIVCYQKANVQ